MNEKSRASVFLGVVGAVVACVFCFYVNFQAELWGDDANFIRLVVTSCFMVGWLIMIYGFQKRIGMLKFLLVLDVYVLLFCYFCLTCPDAFLLGLMSMPMRCWFCGLDVLISNYNAIWMVVIGYSLVLAVVIVVNIRRQKIERHNR